jgi:hypothetical protein
MNDICERCTVRGDLQACVNTPCAEHDSWYAREVLGWLRELVDATEWRDECDNMAGYLKDKFYYWTARNRACERYKKKINIAGCAY